jgi:hypothetical protein
MDAAAVPSGSRSTARFAKLAELKPTLRPGVFVYCRCPPGLDVPLSTIVAAVHEHDGVTVVISEARARRMQLVPLFRCRWISLGLRPRSDSVAVTAGVAAVLADADIACHVMTGLDGDHLFVHVRDVSRAMLRLQAVVQAAQLVDPGPLTVCRAARRA